MHDTVLSNCPFCGNDRVVHVTRFHDEGTDVHSFCAGVLGCHAWWDPADPEPAPEMDDDTSENDARRPGRRKVRRRRAVEAGVRVPGTVRESRQIH